MGLSSFNLTHLPYPSTPHPPLTHPSPPKSIVAAHQATNGDGVDGAAVLGDWGRVVYAAGAAGLRIKQGRTKVANFYLRCAPPPSLLFLLQRLL